MTNYEKDIKEAVEVMRRGGVILYPTDTVWGIGCDATNPDAVARVYEIKHRADSKALICLVDSDARLQRYVRQVPSVAWDVMELSVKPITVILDGAVNLAPNLIAEDGSVAMRITKEAALCRLAQLYLMGEFYTGTQRWADCEQVCNQIIGTGAFKLEARVGDCFREDMEGKSTEVLSAFAVDANQNVGGNEFWLYSQGEWDMAKYGCTAYGARGYCFNDEALNRYEEGDERLELLEYGPQFDLNGNMIDAAGNIVTNPADQLVLKPMTNKRDSKTDEGYIVLKYTPVGGTTKGNSLNNDYVLDRYSNVLLMKCEVLVRQGKDLGTALSLINEVRNRSELRDLTAAELTLENIERERANEFIWEGQRRRDMQRFGSFFTATNWWKTTPDASRNTQFYPIPAQQIAANPNLKQNPGY